MTQARTARAREFRELLLAGRVFRADGAMGTLLHSRGVSLASCFDELNLSAPAMVKRIHREYLEVGAEVLRTNTFGANAARLSKFGFADRLAEINQAGVQLARAAGRDPLVAGAMGPAESRAPHRTFYDQAAILRAAGVDLLILETFTNLGELRQAVYEAREAAGMEFVLVAQMALVDGVSAEQFASQAEAWPVDVIGFNCSDGAATLRALQSAARISSKPLAAFPSAGLPHCLATPESFSNAARQMLASGVKIMGGCCGTTPEHIRRSHLT